jgi:ankyrin repeat protein
VKELLRLGANPHARLPDGQNALHLSAGSVNWDHSAPTLKVLMDAGFAVNAVDNSGFTALHYAALRYSADSIRILLDHAADGSLRGTNGMTPLDLALKYQNAVAARALRGNPSH